MTATFELQFVLSGEELCAIARDVPGLVLPSFVVPGSGSVPYSSSALPRATPSAQGRTHRAPDSRLLLALALQTRADAIVQLVSWSPTGLLQRSVVVVGAVASSLSRRDIVYSQGQKPAPSRYEAALLPAHEIASELARSVPDLEYPHILDESVEVSLGTTRALFTALRCGDPALVDAVASELMVSSSAMQAIRSLFVDRCAGVRVRLFDGVRGRCIAVGDWLGGERGWRRLCLRSRPSAASRIHAEAFVDETNVVVEPATNADIRLALTRMVTALLERTRR